MANAILDQASWSLDINGTDFGDILCIKEFNSKKYGGTDSGKLISKSGADWTQEGSDCPLDNIRDIAYDSGNTRIWVGGDETNVGGTNRSVYYTDDYGGTWTPTPTVSSGGPGFHNDIRKDCLLFVLYF